MSACWAAVLGGCSSRMSGEHAISKSQYGGADSITVQGFPWCRQPKVIGLSSAVANILCKTHNESLSPVDEAAKEVLTALSLVRERSQDTMPPRQFPMRRFTVSGDLFERWMLKTTINLATMGKARPEAGIFDTGGVVAKRYVQIAYGLSQFDLDEGLSWVVKLGDQNPHPRAGHDRFRPVDSEQRWRAHRRTAHLPRIPPLARGARSSRHRALTSSANAQRGQRRRAAQLHLVQAAPGTAGRQLEL